MLQHFFRRLRNDCSGHGEARMSVLLSLSAAFLVGATLA